MKFCNNCGKELLEGTLFCPECGAPVMNETDADTSTDDFAIKQEKECLDNFHRLFRYERTAWKIFAIFWLIFAVFFLFFGIAFSALAVNTTELLFVGVMYIFMGLMYLPLSIISFCMTGKVKYYINTVYNDVRPTIVRCNSVGMIVLGALFNPIAMIFIIINFCRAKGSKYILERAAKRQQEFYQNNQ